MIQLSISTVKKKTKKVKDDATIWGHGVYDVGTHDKEDKRYLQIGRGRERERGSER